MNEALFYIWFSMIFGLLCYEMGRQVVRWYRERKK